NVAKFPDLLNTQDMQDAGLGSVPGQGSTGPMGMHPMTGAPAEERQGQAANGKTPALDYFTTDLSKKAAKGQIDPVIGRKPEIERLVSILNRRTKNNPVLIGEPGVGKTAIVEGLALAITKHEVPDSLLDK